MFCEHTTSHLPLFMWCSRQRYMHSYTSSFISTTATTDKVFPKKTNVAQVQPRTIHFTPARAIPNPAAMRWNEKCFRPTHQTPQLARCTRHVHLLHHSTRLENHIISVGIFTWPQHFLNSVLLKIVDFFHHLEFWNSTLHDGQIRCLSWTASLEMLTYGEPRKNNRVFTAKITDLIHFRTPEIMQLRVTLSRYP